MSQAFSCLSHPAAEESSEEPLLSLPSSVSAGAEVEAYVTTGLSADGVFWAQVEGGREHTAMLKRLQEVVGETKGLYTPVFFSPGDLCTAQFSEDNLWYRARVESIQGERVSGGREGGGGRGGRERGGRGGEWEGRGVGGEGEGKEGGGGGEGERGKGKLREMVEGVR